MCMRVTYPKHRPFDKWAERGWCGPINHPDLGLWQANKIKRPSCIGRRNMERTRVTMTEASRHERRDSPKTHWCMQTQTWIDTCTHTQIYTLTVSVVCSHAVFADVYQLATLPNSILAAISSCLCMWDVWSNCLCLILYRLWPFS